MRIDVFSPGEVYIQESAPIGGKYIAFLNGRRAEWWAGPLYKVSPVFEKRSDGTFETISPENIPFHAGIRLPDISLPSDAELVTVDSWRKKKERC